MDVESVKCECCGLKEDCTRGYISQTKANFEDAWLCGLCSEAVRDELRRGPSVHDLKAAMRAHMSFCQRPRVSPAMGVADGMRQMLRSRQKIKYLSLEASMHSSLLKLDFCSSPNDVAVSRNLA